MNVDFGCCFAYKDAVPSWANLARENQMAKKKTLKKSKKIQPTKPLSRTEWK